MSHRIQRSVLVLCACGLLAPLWPGFTGTARANDLQVRFEEIESYARERSPRARILEQRLAALRGERGP